MSNSFFSLQKLAFFVREVLADFESSVLINQEGQILGLKYESLADLGTFGPLVEMARRYFPLKNGDVVITNDPYSGGNSLSVMSFVTAIEIQDQVFYYAVRTRFKPRMTNAKKLDDEGLRIPPSPIVNQYQLNEAILSAIAAHPLAPEGFEVRTKDTLLRLKARCLSIQELARKNPQYLSKSNQKALINKTRSKIQNLLAEYANGENKMDLHFETGEVVRLKMEIKSGEINFDFSGSSQSQRMFTTNYTTHGICVGAVLSFLEQDILVNEGVFSLIDVTTPRDCLLNAKYPAPIFEGLAEICSVLASGIVQSLSEITGSKSIGMNGSIPTILSFDFGSSKVFFDPLAGGTGASNQTAGVDSFYHWVINRRHTSIEEIERRYPVIVRESSIRAGSGGKGQHSGGNGMLREIEVLQDCSLKWLLGHRNIQTKGLKGAFPGLAPSITHISKSGEKSSISDSVGEVLLKKGDRIISMSAGGGGFGKVGS